MKYFVPALLVFLLAFSLVFNHNGMLWESEENDYYQLLGILLVSVVLFFLGTRKIPKNIAKKMG